MTNAQAALIAAASRGEHVDHENILSVATKWAEWLDHHDRINGTVVR